MPYKQKLKDVSANPRKKPRYKVTNWSAYNKSLKKRGQLSLYFPPGDLKSAFINEHPYTSGLSGQQPTFKAAYTELIYTFYRLKTIFGRKLLSRKWANHQAETHLICCLLNKMTQAGMPKSAKAG